MRNTIKRVWNVVTTVLVGLMVILAALLWGFRLLGFEVLVVQSGSMEPNYHVGSLVYVKPVDASELEIGDVITFELGGGVRGTHRIIEVLDDNGNLSFRTKGDNNDDADFNPIFPEAIVGEVKFAIPHLGFLITYIQQPPGTYVAISVVAVLLLLTILPDLIFPEESKKKEEAK
jgi:signal peptidase